MRLKVVDRLILQELIGPFVFGVLLFTSLFFAGGSLFQLTEYVVKGASLWTVGRMVVLSLPQIMVKTFPMAMLLASLLSFGRLSSEIEIVALHAAGYSLWRIVMPVLAMGAAVSILAVGFNELVVPPATAEMWRLRTAVLRQIGERAQPVTQTVMREGKVETLITAQGGVDLQAGILFDVTAIQFAPASANWHPVLIVYAKRAKWLGGREWDLYDGYWMTGDGRVRAEFERTSTRVLGGGIRKSLREIETDLVPDPDSRSFRQTLDRIRRYRQAGEDTKQMEVELYNKISLPLASLVFGFVGAPLGIRRQRSTAASGFALSIVIIFLYWAFAQYLFILGRGGTISPLLASFLPNMLGAVAGVVILWKRER
ncbi:MAG: LptF/LptG family permease [Armatimonadota bacterium]|nr:LptF/LptG family permease [Armatimonadota bacterium]